MSDPTPDSGTQAATPQQEAASANLSLLKPGPITPPGYTLFEEVGRGGMGVVVRARQVAFDRDLAIKFLRDEFDADSDTARKFVDEARITAQLQHPGIPPIYEIGTLENDRPFIAMKLVKGKALNELLQQGEKVDALAIFEPIAQALGYAHSRGVIHRDLKPHNVMVGAFGEVQLMDWGLAKVLGQTNTELATADTTTLVTTRPDGSGSQTVYGDVKGTPAYMAPEQALGANDRVNERADVFGLGGILCALLTGKAVFVSESGSAKDTRERAAQGQVADAFARLDASGAESDVIALAKQCLSVDPAARPANGNTVAALTAKLRADAIERAKQSEIKQARQRVMLWGAAAVALALVAGIVGTLIGLQRAEEKTILANQQTELAETREAEANAEKAKAIQERDRADRFGEMSAKVLDAMTSDATGDSLATQKELSAEQKKFLEQALTYYEALNREGEGTDVKSQARLAYAAFQLGFMQARLGRNEQARSAYEKSITIRERLAREQPGVTEYQANLATSYNNLGVLQLASGDAIGAIQSHQKAIAIQERLAREQLSGPEYKSNLAASFTNLGNLQFTSGSLAIAIETYRKALSFQEDLARDHPRLPKYHFELAATNVNLGLIQDDFGDTPGAMQSYQKANMILERLAREMPTVPRYHASLAASYHNMGNLQQTSGDTARAMENFQKAITIREHLIRDQPSELEYQVDLAKNYNNLGNMQCNRGDRASAKVIYQKAISLFERLVRDQPGVYEHQANLANSYNNLGLLQQSDEDKAGATACYQKAIAIQERLIQDQPRVPAYQVDLANSCNNLGNLQCDEANIKGGKASYQKAIAIQERLTASQPGVTKYEVILVSSYNNLCLLLNQQRQFKDSLIVLQKCFDIMFAMQKRAPLNASSKQLLRNVYWSRAEAYQGLARFAEALADYDKVIELSNDADRIAIQKDRAACVKLRIAVDGPLEKAPMPRVVGVVPGR